MGTFAGGTQCRCVRCSRTGPAKLPGPVLAFCLPRRKIPARFLPCLWAKPASPSIPNSSLPSKKTPVKPLAIDRKGTIEALFSSDAVRNLSTLIALHHGLGLKAEPLRPQDARELEPALSPDLEAAALRPTRPRSTIVCSRKPYSPPRRSPAHKFSRTVARNLS